MEAQRPDPFLRILAFVSENNRRCIAVLVNNAKESRTVAFRLTNLPWKAAFTGAVLTDETRTMASHAFAGQEVVLPPLSLVTCVWSESDPGRLPLPEEIPLGK